MGSVENCPLTLEQILEKYPPEWETYTITEGNVVPHGSIATAQVCRDENGVLLYAVPHMARWIKLEPKPKQTIGE